MSRGKPRGPKPKDAKSKSNAEHAPAANALDRAEMLIQRLRNGGPNPVTAAEELDRQQKALARDGSLEDIRDRVDSLCEWFTAQPLRGEVGRAWLVLVGAFRLEGYADQVALIADNPGLATPLRIDACRVVAQLRAPDAADTLLTVVTRPGDVQVRTAAAEALAELNDVSVRSIMKALLEEDLPRPLWNAINSAVERIR